jgi:hypothetical protein
MRKSLDKSVSSKKPLVATQTSLKHLKLSIMQLTINGMFIASRCWVLANFQLLAIERGWYGFPTLNVWIEIFSNLVLATDYHVSKVSTQGH